MTNLFLFGEVGTDNAHYLSGDKYFIRSFSAQTCVHEQQSHRTWWTGMPLKELSQSIVSIYELGCAWINLKILCVGSGDILIVCSWYLIRSNIPVGTGFHNVPHKSWMVLLDLQCLILSLKLKVTGLLEHDPWWFIWQIQEVSKCVWI